MTQIKPNGNREDIFEAALREHGFIDPFDYKIEIQVVGAILKAPLRLNELKHILTPDIFYDKWTRRILENICQRYQKGEESKINLDDIILETNDEHRNRVTRDILNHLHQRHIPTDKLIDMIQKLNELVFRRNMLNAAFCILEDAYDGNLSISKLIEGVENTLDKATDDISQFMTQKDFVNKH